MPISRGAFVGFDFSREAREFRSVKAVDDWFEISLAPRFSEVTGDWRLVADPFVRWVLFAFTSLKRGANDKELPALTRYAVDSGCDD
jgi:hypothetical protein